MPAVWMISELELETEPNAKWYSGYRSTTSHNSDLLASVLRCIERPGLLAPSARLPWADLRREPRACSRGRAPLRVGRPSALSSLRRELQGASARPRVVASALALRRESRGGGRRREARRQLPPPAPRRRMGSRIGEGGRGWRAAGAIGVEGGGAPLPCPPPRRVLRRSSAGEPCGSSPASLVVDKIRCHGVDIQT